MPSLDFDAFLKSVSKGEIAPAYYFHGDQDILKDEGLQMVLQKVLEPSTRDFNLDRRRAADLSADDFHSLAMTPPMLAARRAVVITEVEDLQQKRTRALQVRAAILSYLEKPSPDTLLILVQSAEAKLDAELARRAGAVDFRALEPSRVRTKWIPHRAAQIGLKLEPDAIKHLHDVLGEDLAQLTAELAKLKSAVGDRPATAADVADLVGVQRGETVHEFVDAVTGRKFAGAAGMVPHLLTAPGQSGVTLLIALGIALSSVAFARAQHDRRSRGPAHDLKNVFFETRPLGLGDYDERAKRWAGHAESWTVAELDRALAGLLKADRRLKNTSAAGEADIVVEAILSMAAAEVV